MMGDAGASSPARDIGNIPGLRGADARGEEPHEGTTFLALALDASGAGTWSWDVTTNQSAWDERYQALYGFEPGEPPAYETWLARVHPDDREQLRARVQALILPGVGDSWSEEFRVLHPTKGERWMAGLGRVERDREGRARHFRGINLDITERKQADEALRQNLKRSEKIAHVGHWVWNTVTNHVVWSDEVYRILRVRPETFEPRIEALARLIHPDDLARTSRLVQPLVGGGIPGQTVEYRVVLADGTIRHLLSDVAHRITDRNQNVVQLSGILHDITARKRAEAEVLRIGEEERQRVAADLHDGVLQELAGTSYLVAAVQRELEHERHPLASKVRRIERAFAEMIDHTRQVALAMDPTVPGGSGLLGALRDLTGALASTHGISCQLEHFGPVAFDDPVAANHLYRIAQEAMRNAIRHGQAKRVMVRLSQDDGHVCLAVTDDGHGLPADVSSGPGMGLHVMRYRAAVIGGQLTIQARTGGGAEVVCCVTRSAATPANSS
jgi:PAS domain S-box-containing protein